MPQEPILPPPPDLASLDLAEIAKLLAEKRLPPVEKWNPTHCGDSEMQIARDGTWFYQGTPIGRPAMVRLFSTVLRREADGGHVLVTPVEKLDIEVEDTAFIATAVKSEGEGKDRTLAFTTNVGDLVIAGPENRIHFRVAEGDSSDGPVPILDVRGGLEAMIARPVYYELAELALSEGADPPGLWSQGAYFPFEAQ